jgi:site-specific recombinase XerD
MRIEEALGKFLMQLEADGRSIHTVNQYRRHVRAFARWATENALRGDVGAITQEDVARFLASPAAKKTAAGEVKKATSANALRSSLKLFFAFVNKAGYADHDAGRLIRRAITSAGPPKTLTPVEQEKLLQTLARGASYEDRRDAVLFETMLRTGIRVGSAVNLDVADVDLDAGEITLRCKGDRTEKVFIGSEIVERLRKWIGDRVEGPLFSTKDGRRLTTRQVARRLAQWVGNAGIRRSASPHSLRHSFAARLYARTHDILLVKEALRHRSIASTLVYARPDRDRLRAAMA